MIWIIASLGVGIISGILVEKVLQGQRCRECKFEYGYLSEHMLSLPNEGVEAMIYEKTT